MGEFGSNRAAWLIAGFLGRKFMKDLLGRWSVLPILAVACCVWNKWKANQLEGKLEQAKLEEVRRSTQRQLHILRKKSVGGARAQQLAHGTGNPDSTQKQQRRPGDRLGGIPSSSLSTTPKQQQQQRQHLSPTAAAAAAASSSSSSSSVAAASPKDALASELWAWLGGVGSGRSCSADRPKRSSHRSGSGGGGEWRGAFYNRMGNLPRRNAFKTARGKVYLRGGRKGSGGSCGVGAQAPPIGGLEPVREEDEAGVITG